jgi:hypothetical protein
MGLDHGVHPPKEIEVAFLISPHEVARKDNRLARESINLPEPFRRGLRRVCFSTKE